MQRLKEREAFAPRRRSPGRAGNGGGGGSRGGPDGGLTRSSPRRGLGRGGSGEFGDGRNPQPARGEDAQDVLAAGRLQFGRDRIPGGIAGAVGEPRHHFSVIVITRSTSSKVVWPARTFSQPL
ncbi:MAG: hypothetical protein RLZZ221_823 [Verrucomicrobiota bacterium]